jgi:hypothetical protein
MRFDSSCGYAAEFPGVPKVVPVPSQTSLRLYTTEARVLSEDSGFAIQCARIPERSTFTKDSLRRIAPRKAAELANAVGGEVHGLSESRVGTWVAIGGTIHVPDQRLQTRFRVILTEESLITQIAMYPTATAEPHVVEHFFDSVSRADHADDSSVPVDGPSL